MLMRHGSLRAKRILHPRLPRPRTSAEALFFFFSSPPRCFFFCPPPPSLTRVRAQTRFGLFFAFLSHAAEGGVLSQRRGVRMNHRPS